VSWLSLICFILTIQNFTELPILFKLFLSYLINYKIGNLGTITGFAVWVSFLFDTLAYFVDFFYSSDLRDLPHFFGVRCGEWDCIDYVPLLYVQEKKKFLDFTGLTIQFCKRCVIVVYTT